MDDCEQCAALEVLSIDEKCDKHKNDGRQAVMDQVMADYIESMLPKRTDNE